MKTLGLLILVITFNLPLLGRAQVIEVDSMFWILVDSVQLEAAPGSSFTNHEGLNQLFQNYNVTRYEQALPFATTPRLLQVYELACDCEIDSLITVLENLYGNYFSGIKKHYYSEIALYDPADYMWGLTAQDPNHWLWYLKKIQADLAWDITKGNPNVKVAILDTDFDISHPDLAGKIFPYYDPYSNVAFTCNPATDHGSSVASCVAGETAEAGTTPSGQLASVGFKCMMIGYHAWTSSYLAKALHASNVMGANIVTSSAGGWTNCPDPTGIEELAVKEILNNGTAIIMPAGNGVNGTFNTCPAIDPNQHTAFFPLSPYYDERVIIVSSTGRTDHHQFTNGTIDGTHSHFPDVDLCAPGYEVMTAVSSNCGSNGWPYYSPSNGTSFATPIVAGVASLMYSVNPCMGATLCQDILKNTTDPILDAANYPNGVGTGRVNAYRAVKAAQGAYSSSLDLFIKDRPEDFGNEVFPYHWQDDRDESPDIWVRNQADGFSNQVHQDPEFQSGVPVYVYVKVRNKSCTASMGTETVGLYWSKASTVSSWPQNWDGTQTTIGGVIGSQSIGVIQAGNETILEFQWNVANPYLLQNWATCILARIENSSADPITVHPGRLDDDVFYNNNVALRNVTVLDIVPGLSPPGYNDGVYFPHGRYLYIGNSGNSDSTFRFSFASPENEPGNDITIDAEVVIIFDEVGWEILGEPLSNHPLVELHGEKEVTLKHREINISGVEIPAGVRFPVYAGFSFLSEQINEKNEYRFSIRQFEDTVIKGGEHFIIKRYDRNVFFADAGDDDEIGKGDSTLLNAGMLTEDALYNWYDTNGVLINSGTNVYVAPEKSERYRLEVIATSDGVKDYDDVKISVNPFSLQSITPNPASNQVQISYDAMEASAAIIMILNHSGTVTNTYNIETHQSQTQISLTSYMPGTYSVVLMCDGVAVDSKSLIIQ